MPRFRCLLAAISLLLSPSPNASAAQTADVIFLIDGSGSVSRNAFALQLDAIRNCVCAPGAPVRLDGSVSVAVVQFSFAARIEIEPMVLAGPEEAQAFCAAVDSVVQMRGLTRALPGLEICEDLFEDSASGTERSLIVLTDTVLFDPNLTLVEIICRRMRTDDDPVKICGAITDETIAFQTDLFNRLCNTPSSSEFNPAQPVGMLTRVQQISNFQPVCAECVAACAQISMLDCDGDGVPNECEPDCNANGIPDDCDIAADPMLDMNGNGVLDTCDDDCNSNGLADFLDIESGGSTDCNENGIPDECEGGDDCNNNGIPDFCELDAFTRTDCNINGIDDTCETVPFPVVTTRVIAMEGQYPTGSGQDAPLGTLTLGVAIDSHANVWFGDVGMPNTGTQLGGPFQGRIFRYDLATDRFAVALREGDLVAGGATWLTDPPPDCGPIEAAVQRLPSDLDNAIDGDGLAAIRGLTDDGNLLVRASVFVTSAFCQDLDDDLNALLHVTPDRTSTVLFRERLDPCLLSDVLTLGAARPRANGRFFQPEVQTDDGSSFAWLVSQAADGGCAEAQSGGIAPDGSVYDDPDYTASEPGPFTTVARHASSAETLFYAAVTDERTLLVLHDSAGKRLVASDGTPVALDGNPPAPLSLAFDGEEGSDAGPLLGTGTDVVFRGTAGGVHVIFAWSGDDNPVGMGAQTVFSPIVTEADLAPLVDPVPGSVRFRGPMIGGPCGSCLTDRGLLLFSAEWDDADAQPDTDPARTGLFVKIPGGRTHAVALSGQRLPEPYSDRAYVRGPGMLAGMETDINANGQLAFTAFVEPIDEDGKPTGTPSTSVILASIKPGPCDLRPQFGTLDLADITTFISGFTTGAATSDLAEPRGVFDLADLVGFVSCFLSPCP